MVLKNKENTHLTQQVVVKDLFFKGNIIFLTDASLDDF